MTKYVKKIAFIIDTQWGQGNILPHGIDYSLNEKNIPCGKSRGIQKTYSTG
jgi:hypothetical protein